MLKHKFKAIRTEHDNIKFSSKKECKRYIELKLLKEKGEVLFFLRQVLFHLDGGVKWVADFLVFWLDGNVTVEDPKGVKTPLYIAKKKMVEAIYPISITEI